MPSSRPQGRPGPKSRPVPTFQHPSNQPLHSFVRQAEVCREECPLFGMSAFPACSGAAIIFWGAALSPVSRVGGPYTGGFAGCSGGSGYGAGRGGRRSYGRGSRVCPDSRRRARCRSRGGHQIVVAPRVRCALAGLVLTVAVAADSVSAALWSLTRAGWLPVLGVAQPGPQGARRTTGSKPRACWQGGERPGRSRTVPHGRHPARSPSRLCPWWRLPS